MQDRYLLFNSNNNRPVGQTGEGDTACDASYPDDCIPPPPPNLNCDDDGVPENFKVVGSDPHGFDGDNDGIGCETSSGGSDDSEDGDDDGGAGDGGDEGGGSSGGGDEGGSSVEEMMMVRRMIVAGIAEGKETNQHRSRNRNCTSVFQAPIASLSTMIGCCEH